MKFLRLLMVFFAAGLVFSSCQKELSFEGGEATGTLKADATGDCLPVIINGTYKKDTLLIASNSVDVTADIIITGTYFIKTDTINGYSFSASGNAAVAGPTTIHLVGSGRPLNPGVDVFTVKFGESTCQINIIVTIGTGVPTADYTFATTAGVCTGATLTGTYTAGAAVTGNTATLNVNVVAPGTYTLGTGPINGVTFTGSGTFAAAGPNTIILTASGTAGAVGTFTYPVAAGASTCSFDVVYVPAGPAGTYSVNCTGAVVGGTYQVGTPMTASNQMTVSVTTLTAGTYTITSGPVNGVTFTGSGTLAAGGPNPIILTATGTPLAAGPFNFPLNGNPVTAPCNVPVTFTAAAPPAAYTINCGTPATFTGAFQPGVATTGTMTVEVIVTTVGPYTITSGPVNGVTFTKSGTFTTATTQNVTLNATGTGTAAGGFVFAVPGSTGSCNFTVFFDGMIATLGSTVKTFNFPPNPGDPTAAYDNTTVPGYTYLTLTGYHDASSFEQLLAAVANTTGTFAIGTYTINQGPAILAQADYVLPDNSDYYDVRSNPPTVQTPVFTVTITSINATRVTGTFTSGSLLNNAGAGPGTLAVTNGSFSLLF